MATTYKLTSVVQLLLCKDADVTIQGGHYGNALRAGSVGCHTNVLQLLLDKVADVNVGEGKGGGIMSPCRLLHEDTTKQNDRNIVGCPTSASDK